MAEMRSMRVHVAVVALLGVVLFVAVAFLLWAALGFAPLDAATRFNLVKLALSVVAGIGGVLALVVAYRRQRLNEAAEQRERTKLFNERFVSASAQLGHESPAVRLAGVYAVAGLADDWPEQRQTCIDVLCAYLRMPYEPASSDWHHDDETEIRLSLTGVIRDHLRDGAAVSWRGHDFDFTRAVLRGADFSGAEFIGGKVSFSLTRFAPGGWTAFDRARFVCEVSFGGAEFLGGRVTFDGANFEAGKLRFDGAEFTGGRVSFRGARFTGGQVDLSGVDVERFDVPPEFDSPTPPGVLLPVRPTGGGS